MIDNEALEFSESPSQKVLLNDNVDTGVLSAQIGNDISMVELPNISEVKSKKPSNKFKKPSISD